MRPLKNMCEIAIIGGGLAGLAAAREAARLGRLVTLFEGSGLFGGLVATIGTVEDLPFPGQFSGQELAMHLYDEARMARVQLVEASIAKLVTGEALALIDSAGDHHRPATIIVASGASLRKLGVPGEEEFIGRGVSRCATCDGGFYRGNDVVVVGGGNGAVHEALELAKHCSTVTMVCRSPMRAKREHIDKLDARENVRFVWDSDVLAIHGDGKVGGVRLRNIKNGDTRDLDCAGVFPFIGVEPNSSFMPKPMLNKSGYIKTSGGYATSDARVFAAGAARADYGGTALEAMAEGIGAARAAVRSLTKMVR